jgi:hypothetical protein
VTTTITTSSSIVAERRVAGATRTIRPATGDRPVRNLRRLRLTAYALGRSLRDPRRLPGHWATPAFAARVDRVRAQLLPIRTLAALADSFGREHGVDEVVVRLAYGLRWLELSGVLDERPWRLHCRPRPR